MKSVQIFVSGAVVLLLFLFLPFYESVIAGTAATLTVAMVIFGFLLRPRKDMFYVDTRLQVREPDNIESIEHDLLAVRLEVARLWLLFVPTFVALAFLVVTATKGTTWRFSLLQAFLGPTQYGGYLFVMTGRIVLLIVFGCLSTWIGERWVLRNAVPTNARSVIVKEGRISYIFLDTHGGYYGGEAFPFTSVKPQALGRIVFFNPQKPESNKIAVGLLFHRPVVVGRGLTDLDQKTVRRFAQARLSQT